MNTTIKSLNTLRYPTAGDYYHQNGINKIEIFEQDNDDYNFLIGLHEYFEEYATRKRGITEKSITEFDLNYERNRKEGDFSSEPGNDPSAPYHECHLVATKIEKIAAEFLGVDWNDYDKNIKVYNGFNIE